MIPVINRFHGHGSLRYVYSHGKAVRSPLLTIKSVPNDRRRTSRFSVVISKKIIKSAVGRNRVRRRLYEYIRAKLPVLGGTFDIVFICTSAELRTMPAAELHAQLDQVWDKAALPGPAQK